MSSLLTILGKRGSGKTTLAQRLIKAYSGNIVIADPLGEYQGGVIFDNLSDFATRFETWTRGPGRWIFRLTRDQDYKRLFLMVWELEDCLLVLEESDLFSRPAFTEPELERLVKYGRHRNISIMFISRRAAELGRNCTAQSDSIITFRQTEPRDLAVLKQLSIEGARASELGEYEYIIIGELPEIFKSVI